MKKKILALCLVLTLAATAVIGTTLAYFTDTTDEVENVFTVGKIDITLTEPAWDPAADHTLMPGTSYEKDPTVAVAADSRDAWVFLKVEVNQPHALLALMGMNHLGAAYTTAADFEAAMLTDTALRAAVLGEWFDGINHADWAVMNTAEIEAALADPAADTLTVVLGYQNGAMTAGDEATFMTGFGMPAAVDQSMLAASGFTGTLNLTFTAYAIQAENVASLADAYAALFA